MKAGRYFIEVSACFCTVLQTERVLRSISTALFFLHFIRYGTQCLADPGRSVSAPTGVLALKEASAVHAELQMGIVDKRAMGSPAANTAIGETAVCFPHFRYCHFLHVDNPPFNI